VSMIGCFVRIPAELLSKLKADPDSVETVLAESGESSQIPDDARLDVDKSWHIIHFLLTGDAWGGPVPLANAVCGGTELGDVDVGYGPAKFLEPSEVGDVAVAISGITSGELWSRFDTVAVKAADIYPSDSWSSTDFSYVKEHYEHLRSFYSVAAQRGEAVMFYLS
jgi:hypothetical protein